MELSMKRLSLTLAACASAALAAPAAKPAAPAPVAAPEPVAAAEPAYVPAPAPVAAPVAAPAASVGSPAPFAQITDGLVQSNPAGQGSMSSVLSVPHRWAGKRVASFSWTPGNVLAYGTLDSYFAGFRTNSGRGDLTGGYTTTDWAAGLTVNFAKRWMSTSDSINHVYQPATKASQTYNADGFALVGSYKLDDLHLYGNIAFRNMPDTSWSVEGKTAGPNGTSFSYSGEYDSVGATIGVRTYVTGDEGLAWRATFGFADIYMRPSDVELAPADSEYENTDIYVVKATGDVGYRIAAPGKSQLAVGVNSAFTSVNGKPEAITYPDPLSANIDSVDYFWEVTVTPNASVLLPLAERWTFIGGASLQVAYNSSDAEAGEDEANNSSLMTGAPKGSLGVRYAKDNWALQAQVDAGYLNAGPYFMSGNQTGNVLTSVALTVNLK